MNHSNTPAKRTGIHRFVRPLLIGLVITTCLLIIYVFAFAIVNLDKAAKQVSYDRIVWSPNGEHIALGTSSRYEGYNIYLMNRDSLQMIKLDAENAHDPVWSPDSTKIAYVKGISVNTQEIFVADIATFEQFNLVQAYVLNSHLAWSPDGERIAFISSYDGSPQLYIVNKDGSELRRLTDQPTPLEHFVWSPDGENIAFVFRNTTKQFTVSAVNISTLKITSFTPDDHVIFPLHSSTTLAVFGSMIVDFPSNQVLRLRNEDLSARLISYLSLSPSCSRVIFIEEGDLVLMSSKTDELLLTDIFFAPYPNIHWDSDNQITYLTILGNQIDSEKRIETVTIP